jgi:hypothetical protein
MGNVEQGIAISSEIEVIIENTITLEVRRYKYHNICTNAFLSRIAQWISGVNNTGQNPAYTPSKFQLGTGTGVPAKTDSALYTATPASLVNLASVSFSGNQTTLSVNYPQNGFLGTFTEGGLLDVNSVLLTHLILSPPITILANEVVSFIYLINIDAV